jgi:hypothetical protein
VSRTRRLRSSQCRYRYRLLAPAVTRMRLTDWAPMLEQWCLVLPVKRLDTAKTRLTELAADRRAELALACGRHGHGRVRYSAARSRRCWW